MHDKVVEEDLIALSICNRRNTYVTMSGKNDICLFPDGNDTTHFIYKRFNTSPQDAKLHIWGYQLFLIFYKHVEVYTLLDKEFQLSNKFNAKTAISNFKISDNGALIALSSMNTIMVFDA